MDQSAVEPPVVFCTVAELPQRERLYHSSSAHCEWKGATVSMQVFVCVSVGVSVK